MGSLKLKSGVLWIISSLLIIFADSSPMAGQTFSHSPEPWRTEYEISLKGFEFSHPMTVISGEELSIIRQRILYNVEPQHTAWLQLKSNADAALEFAPNAPQLLEIPGGYVDPNGLEYARNLLWGNCHAAYSCALRYAITGEQLYAEKAVEVLMNWANKGTRFYGDDSGLQLGSYFSPMLYAADLLHDYSGWTTADRNLFKTWWRSNCLEDGDILGVLRRKDNNWKDAALLGTFAASVVLEDTLLLKEALVQLKSYFFSRTDGNVQIPGKQWKIAVDEQGVYLPREVVRNDGRSGLTYTAYALTTMVQGMEIARYAGFDFWQDTTELGATLGDVIQQYYEWDVLNEPFPWNNSATKSDKRRNCYEIANLKYDFSSDYKHFIEKARPIAGREGDEYSTLNKGDLTGIDTIPAAAPSNLTSETLSGTKIRLTWTDNSGDEYGFKIERSSGQDFSLIDSCGPGTGFYLDTGLLAGTTYTYRVYAFKASQQVLYSNESACRTQDYPEFPPEVPAGFNAIVMSSEQVKLTWNDNSDTEEGYIIERKSEEEYMEIAHPGVNDTLFSDTGVEANTSYTYRIRAYNLAGYSDYSDQAAVTTLANGGIFQEENGVVSMEAEYGEKGSVWSVGQDEFASGSKFLEVNPTRNNTGDQPECELHVCLTTYFFTIKEGGDYTFWFRILSEGDENDSFFWRIGTGSWIMEEGRSGIGNWYQTKHEQLNNLPSGGYILEISYGENGTRLDKFVFQKETIAPPEGTGPEQSDGIFPLPPKKPASLTAIALSSSSIEIKWTDYASDEDGYVIERKENESYVNIAQLGQNANSYIDTGLVESTSYIYRVYAFNASGNSNFSNQDSATTLKAVSVFQNESEEGLLSCYPNPFSESTTIRFSLNIPASVSLAIYNATGQQIAQLEEAFLNEGVHYVEWDGTYGNRKNTPSGIYFCTLKYGVSGYKVAPVLKE